MTGVDDVLAVRVLGAWRDLQLERQTSITSDAAHMLTKEGAEVVAKEHDFAGVHPELVSRVLRVLAAMAALGFPMTATAGVRSLEEQARLYAQGRTEGGAVVTQADGVRVRSNHQVGADGLGHAVDCAFLDAGGRPTWEESLPWSAFGACAEAVGLQWGGRWARFPDRPHVEWHGAAETPGVKA